LIFLGGFFIKMAKGVYPEPSSHPDARLILTIGPVTCKSIILLRGRE
jgi:hypothetical protein